MDPLKEAFQKIKEDISSLKTELSSLRSDIFLIKTSVDSIKEIQESLKVIEKTQETPVQTVSGEENALYYASDSQTDNDFGRREDIMPLKTDSFQNNSQYKANYPQYQTTQTDFASDGGVQTDFQTQNLAQRGEKAPLEPLYPQKTHFSIGNEGVQTDNPTDQLTNSHSSSGDVFNNNRENANPSVHLYDTLSKFEKVNEILASLDDIKKEVRHKFKTLTPQEMLVFSTLYTLEDQKIEEIGYFILAKSINLTESSIRDYINKLIKKGIPIDKTRLNNKKIILKISPNLKKIATLSTIMRLRDL